MAVGGNLVHSQILVTERRANAMPGLQLPAQSLHTIVIAGHAFEVYRDRRKARP
jgi:hypothetical protein